MKINISSSIPCNLFLEGVQYETPITLTIPQSGRVQISVLPAYPERFSSYTLILSAKNDRLIELSGGARAVSWGEIVDVYLTPPIIQSHFTPEVIAQKRLSRDLVTLYDDGRKKLMLEGSSFFNFDLPENVTDLTLKAKEVDRGAIVSVMGKLEEKDYLLALLCNGEWQIMHQLTADRIEITKTGVKTTDIIPSMLRYEKRCFYKPFSNEPEECTYTPTVRHTYPSVLVPYLFLEDVFFNSPNCLNYLHPSIGLNLDGIVEFFGEVDTATHPCFDEFDITTVAVYDSKSRISHPDLYKFELENDKIVNIIHLLTCN